MGWSGNPRNEELGSSGSVGARWRLWRATDLRQLGDVLDQPDGVRIIGVLENLLDRPRLDDPTLAQHDGRLGNAPHKGKIVGDKDHGQTSLALELSQHLDRDRLHGNVKRRCHLIAHEQFWLDDDGPSYRHSLTLTTRELIRVAAKEVKTERDILEDAR